MSIRVFAALLIASVVATLLIPLNVKLFADSPLEFYNRSLDLAKGFKLTSEVSSSKEEKYFTTEESIETPRSKEEEYFAKEEYISTEFIHEAKAEEEDKDMKIFLREREEEYERRRQHVRQVCETSGTKLRFGNYKDIDYEQFRWLNDRKLVMCLNAKVGSTTWSNYLVKAVNQNATKASHIEAAQLLSPPCNLARQECYSMIDSYTKVITVRHPFSRLMSAYYGKITTNRVQKSVRELREMIFGSAENKTWISFQNFAKYVVLTTPVEDDILIKRDSKTNIHWFSFYANCNPCDIDYGIIAKKETLSDDLRYLDYRFHLNVTFDTVLNKGRKSTEDETYRIFKKLPRNLTLALYERYRPDFELFGYSIEDYLAEE